MPMPVGKVGNSWDIKIPWDGDLTTHHISELWQDSIKQSIENQMESVMILTRASLYLKGIV